jgi:VanZ family protein
MVSRPTRLLIVFGWMVLLTFWSGQSNLPIDHPPISTLLHGFQHRVAHLVAFGLLALLARWAFDGWPRAALLAVLLTSAFGASDELHQTLTPGRRPAVDDWLVDTLAAMLAMVVFWPRLQLRPTLVRPLASAVVISLFVIGIGLGLRGTPVVAQRPSVRALPTQVVHSARDLVHSLRSG